MPIRTGMAQGVIDALTSMGLSTGLTGVNWSLNWGGVNQYAVHSPWASSGHGDKIEFSFVADNPGTTNQYLFMSPTGNPYFDILANASLYYRYIDADGTTVRTITGPTIVAGVLYVGHILMKGDGVDLVVNGTTYSTVNPQLLTTDLTHIAAHAPVSEYFNGTINYLRYVNATAIQNTYANIGDGVRYGELEQSIVLEGDFEISFDWIRQDSTGTGLTNIIDGSDAGVGNYGFYVGDTGYSSPDCFFMYDGGDRIIPNAYTNVAIGKHCSTVISRVSGIIGVAVDGVDAVGTLPLNNKDTFVTYIARGLASQRLAANSALQNIVIKDLTQGLTWNYGLDEGSGTDIINSDPSTQGNYNNEPIFDTDALMGDGTRYIEIPQFTVGGIAEEFRIAIDFIRPDNSAVAIDLIGETRDSNRSAVILVAGTDDIGMRCGSAITTFTDALLGVAVGQHVRLEITRTGSGQMTGTCVVNGIQVGQEAIADAETVITMLYRSYFNANILPANSALQNVKLQNITTGEAIGYKINEGSGLDVIAYDIVNGELGAPVPAKNGTITPDADWQYITEYSNNGAWAPDTDWQFMPQLSRNYKMNDGPDALFLEDSLNPLGPEEITTPDFSSSTGYTLDGGWSISGGRAIHTGGGDYLKQLTGGVVGKLYLVTVDVAVADDTNFVQVYLGTSPALGLVQAPGVYSFVGELLVGSLGFALRSLGDVEVNSFSVKCIETGAVLNNVAPADWIK